LLDSEDEAHFEYRSHPRAAEAFLRSRSLGVGSSGGASYGDEA